MWVGLLVSLIWAMILIYMGFASSFWAGFIWQFHRDEEQASSLHRRARDFVAASAALELLVRDSSSSLLVVSTCSLAFVFLSHRFLQQ